MPKLRAVFNRHENERIPFCPSWAVRKINPKASRLAPLPASSGKPPGLNNACVNTTSTKQAIKYLH